MIYDSNELKIVFASGTMLTKKTLDSTVQTKALNIDDAKKIYDIAKEITESNPLFVFKILHLNQPEDDVVYTHSFNVAIISLFIAKWCNLKEPEMQKVFEGAIMHDIGKLFVDDDVLNKEDKLSHTEKAQVSSHTVEGYKEFRKTGLDIDILSSILMHHERMDGSGYPLGLHDEKINKFARIIAIADKYEGMTSKRRYRDPYTPFDAVSHIDNVKFKFDDNFVNAFLENMYEVVKQSEKVVL